MHGKSIVLEMDANSKLGPEYIKEDPHSQSQNGHILSGIIKRHNLIVVNGLEDKCTGVIPRRRVTKDSIEESAIDFVIISNDLLDSVESLYIDEERKHILTKYRKKKNIIEKIESDHHVLYSKLKFTWSKKLQRQKIELFILKNSECHIKFKEVTSSSDFLSSVFNSSSDLNSLTNKFLKRLKGCLHESFKKIKVSDRTNKELEELFDRRRILRSKDDVISKQELKEVEEKLANKCAEENYSKICEEIAGIRCEEGGLNSGKLWKLRKKLFSKKQGSTNCHAGFRWKLNNM